MTHDPEDPFGWPPAESGAASRPTPADAAGPTSPEPEESPPTEPSAALVPPPKLPPAAVAAAALPPPPPRLPPTRWEQRRITVGSFDLIAVVNRVLDTLDVVGDNIAEAAGIRPRNG